MLLCQSPVLPMTKTPYRIPFDDASMDVVVSTSVLEHAFNVDEVFSEIGRVLRPGGLACVSGQVVSATRAAHLRATREYLLATDPQMVVVDVGLSRSSQ